MQGLFELKIESATNTRHTDLPTVRVLLFSAVSEKKTTSGRRAYRQSAYQGASYAFASTERGRLRAQLAYKTCRQSPVDCRTWKSSERVPSCFSHIACRQMTVRGSRECRYTSGSTGISDPHFAPTRPNSARCGGRLESERTKPGGLGNRTTPHSNLIRKSGYMCSRLGRRRKARKDSKRTSSRG